MLIAKVNLKPIHPIACGHDRGREMAEHLGLENLVKENDRVEITVSPEDIDVVTVTYINGLIGKYFVDLGEEAFKEKFNFIAPGFFHKELEKAYQFLANVGKPIFKDPFPEWAEQAKWIFENGIKSEDYPNDHGRHVMDGFILIAGGVLVGYKQGPSTYIYQTKIVNGEVRYFGDPVSSNEIPYEVAGDRILITEDSVVKDVANELTLDFKGMLKLQSELNSKHRPVLLRTGNLFKILALRFGQ